MYDIPLDMRNLQLPLHVSIHMSCQLDFTSTGDGLEKGENKDRKNYNDFHWFEAI